MDTIFGDFIIGIVSGLVVTIYYRYKDARREGHAYLHKLLKYSHEFREYMLKSRSAFANENSAYNVNKEKPAKPYKPRWIKCGKEQKKIMAKLEECISEISTTIFLYSENQKWIDSGGKIKGYQGRNTIIMSTNKSIEELKKENEEIEQNFTSMLNNLIDFTINLSEELDK